MGMLDEEPGVNAANEAAQPDHPRASSPRPVPCNDTTGHILPITSEEQAQDARSIAAFVERMLAMPDEDPPGSGLETCPSVGEMARSGDLATTWSVIAKTPGNDSRPVLRLRTRFIDAGAFFCKRWGSTWSRNVSHATSAAARLRRPVGLTALRRADVFAFESGPASWKHAPTPERCSGQEPLGRKWPAALTLCYKVSGPFRALSQWTQGKEMEMIENRQNKAG